MKKLILGLFCLCLSQLASAQAIDTLRPLGFKAFLDMVLINHPMVRQADIATERGAAQLRQARGAFDPVLEGGISNKMYDGTSYYDLRDYGIKIPTWFGIEAFAGYNRTAGTYFNPENRTPADGQWQAGLSLPLGQGLWVDKRRTELRKAQAIRDASFVEREQMLNDLLLQSGRAYWQWQQHYREFLAYQQAEVIAEEVLDAVRLAFLFGDRAAVDTLEAAIQLQNWQQLRIDAGLKYQTSGYELATFLWDGNGRPLELSENSKPDTSAAGSSSILRLPNQPLSAALNNPAYRLIDYRQRQLKYEERWQFERLKPDVRVKLYGINEPTRLDINPFPGQRAGIDFKFPLLLRDARGSLKLVRLQQESLTLDQNQRALGLTNRLAALQLEFDQLDELIEAQTVVVTNLRLMLDAEKIRFTQGESSIFIINQREAQLVSGKIRLINLQNRQEINRLQQLHLTGELRTVPR